MQSLGIFNINRNRVAAPINSYVPILNPQAKIGILCDSILNDVEFNLSLSGAQEKASNLITALGYIPVIDFIHATTQPYYKRWFGSPGERADHFIRLVEEYEVDAVYPLFGKSGGSSVIDEIIKKKYKPSRKVVFIGSFSQHSDWGLFASGKYGKHFFSCVLNATQCAYHDALPASNVQNLAAILTHGGEIEFNDIVGMNDLAKQLTKNITGKLIGGNLGVLLMNLHKKWFPPLKGAIVFCEDYDRHVHDYHRHIELFAFEAHKRGAKAILLGDHLPIRKRGYFLLEKDKQKVMLDEERAEIMCSLQEVASRVPLPIFYKNGMVGHGLSNLPMGIGCDSMIHLEAHNKFKLINNLGGHYE